MGSRVALVCLPLALTLLPACQGCKSKSEGPSGTASAAASGSAKHRRKPPRDGGTRAPAASADPDRWLRGLPPGKPAVKPGDRVWALSPLPGQSTASFGVMEIDSVQDDGSVTAVPLVVVAGKLKRDDTAKRPRTPGALLTPAAPIDPAKIKAGDFVIAPIPGYRTTVAQVSKTSGKTADVKYVNGDKVLDATVEYAVPMAQGVAPFAFGAYVGRPPYQEILIAAVVESDVFGIDEAGNAIRAFKQDVRPLNVEWKERKKGDVVVVFDGGRGVDTMLDAEIVPKWIYSVKFGGKEKPIPFYAIFEKI